MSDRTFLKDNLSQDRYADCRSLRSVQTHNLHVMAAIALVICLIVAVVALAFVPWQQSVVGVGKVIVFTPKERPQNIQSAIPARLKRWYVRDGQQVKKGQIIAELSELDPKFLDPQQVRRMQEQKERLISRGRAIEDRISNLREQLDGLKRSQLAALPSAAERAKQAEKRIFLVEQNIEALKEGVRTADLNLTRMKELHESGLRSKRDFELSQLEQAKAKTELARACASLEIAQQDHRVAQYEKDKTLADTDATINSLEASVAAAVESKEAISAEILKLEVEVQNLEQRVQQRKVFAPADGRIVRLLKVGEGETLDGGEIMAVLAPKTNDLVAELFVRDNDAPLVSVGRQVRLQFAGWPALQFSGWPSVAVGTFAGRVSVIDAVDDGQNNYRVIVEPDKTAISSKREELWPSADHLRPGAEVTGWIMLDTVPLGFELWRQFNAFPPTVKPESLGLQDKKSTKSEIKRKVAK